MGAIVTILKNYVAEQKLTNILIGTVKIIVYDDPRGPNLEGSLPLYVVFEFKESTLDNLLIPGNPSTYVPIPVVNNMCEKKCCTIRTIPLRVCKSITLYKSQRLTVGPDQV